MTIGIEPAYTSEASAKGHLVVEDLSLFENFEGVGVGTTNIGYVMIGNPGSHEIVSIDTAYVSGSSQNLVGIATRAMFGTSAGKWEAGTPLYKYELGGVSLARINKLHSLTSADTSANIKFDSYTLKIDMTGEAGATNRDGTGGYPALYLSLIHI